MLFHRILLDSAGGSLPQPARSGQGFPFAIKPTILTTNADHTMTVAQMASGALVYTSLSAGRQVTTPTAALILAAASTMDVGDTFTFIVTTTQAFALTWAAGVGVTLAGRATVPASETCFVTVEKTSSTTVTWTVY